MRIQQPPLKKVRKAAPWQRRMHHEMRQLRQPGPRIWLQRMPSLLGDKQDTKHGLFRKEHRVRSPLKNHQTQQRIIKTSGPANRPGPPAIAGAQLDEGTAASGAVWAKDIKGINHPQDQREDREPNRGPGQNEWLIQTFRQRVRWRDHEAIGECRFPSHKIWQSRRVHECNDVHHWPKA